MQLFSNSLFVPPPGVKLDNYKYMPHLGIDTYSDYNYLRPGIAGRLRLRHFEYALRLTRQYFHKCNVIDFACGDGPFLPSLSKYFNHVTAIDQSEDLTKLAGLVAEKAGLRNVSVICNRNQTMEETKTRLGGRDHQVLFMLEALEHVGSKDDPWNSRVTFLSQVSSLLSGDGIIVVSVPNMIGIPFLLQRLGMAMLRQDRERLSISDLLKAGLRSNTGALEKRWSGGHLGFNHRKLETHLSRDFTVVKRKSIFWQVVYVLKPKGSAE